MPEPPLPRANAAAHSPDTYVPAASAGPARQAFEAHIASGFCARIEPAGDRFDAPADLPLLEAAERSGLSVISSCRNGTCRACRVQLLSGEVAYRIEWPGLSAEEKKSGCLLPCVAYPLSDVVWTAWREDAP